MRNAEDDVPPAVQAAIQTEERHIYVVVLGAMVPVVIATLLTRGVFDAGATVCLGLLVLAVLGLFATALASRRRRRALPEVRARRAR